jgi:hypothetical protein
MARKKPKPVLLKGNPVTVEEAAKVYGLSKRTVARLEALVKAVPQLQDSKKTMQAGS